MSAPIATVTHASRRSKTLSVLVTGDQTIDWAVRPLSKYDVKGAEDRLHVRVNLLWHKGGMFLLRSMINDAVNVVPRKSAKEANQSPLPTVKILPSRKPILPSERGLIPTEDKLIAYGTGYNHSYAEVYEYDDKDYGDTAFRVRNYLGFRERDPGNEVKARYTRPPKRTPTVVVIDDADLGFRDSESNWKGILPGPSEESYQPWVILKMSYKIANGPLWDHVRERLADGHDWLSKRLVALTAVARLRDRRAEISKNLSWERSVYDSLTEIDERPELHDLKNCPYLITSFGPSGVLQIRRGPELSWRLTYDPERMEGEWAGEHKDGMMFGYGSALCASLARQLVHEKARRVQDLDLSPAIEAGLTAMHKLYHKGFVVLDNQNEFWTPPEIFEDVADADRKMFPKPLKTPWNSTYDRVKCPPFYGDHNSVSDASFAHEVAREVARKGAGVLRDYLPEVPVSRFGDLFSMDRREIEGLHSITNLIEHYCDGRVDLGAKPLAIGVFGSPGSGKGFAVDQLAFPWIKRDKPVVERLNVNLSQLLEPRELVGALHQVRDISLGGRVPLVLWDEFDAPIGREELGWLRYFLAPIQDGKFQEGDTIHQIGPSIFVFAGGTCETFAAFHRTAQKANPEAKATDFISRIRGFIDIADVNPPIPEDVNRSDLYNQPRFDRRRLAGYRHPPRRHQGEPADLHLQLILRRALTLYGLFKKHNLTKGDEGYDVEPGVLTAFLEVSRFKHGVRSMEAIIHMSRLGLGQPYSRWALPSQDQLDLHVDGAEFMKVMRQSVTA